MPEGGLELEDEIERLQGVLHRKRQLLQERHEELANLPGHPFASHEGNQFADLAALRGHSSMVSRAQTKAHELLRHENAKDVIGWGLLASGVPYSDIKQHSDLMHEAAQQLEHGSEVDSAAKQKVDAMLSHAASSKHARRDRVQALCCNRSDVAKSIEPLGRTISSRDLSPKKIKAAPRPKVKKPEQGSMPFNQVRSMFSEKMKAIMMQDRGQLRKIFQKYDSDKKGILSAAQFHQLCCAYDLGLGEEESRAFLAQFTSGKPFMSFQDFFQNMLGFPYDFFQMKFADNQPKKQTKDKELVTKLPPSTSDDKITSLFVRSLRRELYDVHMGLSLGLKKERDDAHLTADHIFKIFHSQGIELSKIEIAEIIDHYDFDCDGKVDYLEFIYELLDLPLPRQVRNILPVPRRTTRPPLGPRTKKLMEMLRAQCRKAAVSTKKLDHMFSVYDQDGSGSIAYDEVQGMVKEFHCEAEGKDAAAVVLERFSPSGAMNYDEFCSKVIGLPQGSHQAKEVDLEEERLNPLKLRERISESIKGKIYRNPAAVKKAFVMFDKDCGGSVSWPEFRDGFISLGLPASQKQMHQLFQEFSPSANGEIKVKPFSKQLLFGAEEVPAAQAARSRSCTPAVGHAGMAPEQPSLPRPKSSMDVALKNSRGASRLSIRPGSTRSGNAVGSTTPAHAFTAQYLIRPTTGRTTEIVRRPGSRAPSRAAALAGGRSSRGSLFETPHVLQIRQATS